MRNDIYGVVNMKRGQALTELRRSHASGVHDHVPTRSQTNREAVRMSMLDLDYPAESGFSIVEDLEPPDSDLEAIALEEEAGLYGDDRFVDFSDDEYDTSDLYDREYDF